MKSEAMVWAGEECRKVLETANLFPAGVLGPQDARGMEAMIAEAAARLTRQQQVALWLLALAWEGGYRRQ